MLAAPVLGFDTESKPTFRKGEESDGPHLIQLADSQCAWLVPVVKGVLPEEIKPCWPTRRIRWWALIWCPTAPC
jgi:RNA polymerase sigma factor for flagellar operon FliA